MRLRWTLPIAVMAVVVTFASVEAGLRPSPAPGLGGPVLLGTGASVSSTPPERGPVDVVEPHTAPEPVVGPSLPSRVPASGRSGPPGTTPAAPVAPSADGTTAAPRPTPPRSSPAEHEPGSTPRPTATRTPAPSRTSTPPPTPSHRATG